MADPYGMCEALKAIEEENPLNFTFGGVDYPCVRGDSTFMRDLGMGGYAPNADLVIVARYGALPSPAPTSKSEIVVAGRTYLVEQVVNDPNRVFGVFSLSDPNKAT